MQVAAAETHLDALHAEDISDPRLIGGIRDGDFAQLDEARVFDALAGRAVEVVTQSLPVPILANRYRRSGTRAHDAWRLLDVDAELLLVARPHFAIIAIGIQLSAR